MKEPAPLLLSVIRLGTYDGSATVIELCALSLVNFQLFMLISSFLTLEI